MSENRILGTWRLNGIELNPGASLKSIQRLEQEIDFEFPQSFKEVYQSVNGFGDFDWTPNMFSFFSLNRIKEEHSRKGYWKGFVPIFDYLINSYHIGYIKGRKGIFKDYSCKEIICDDICELFCLIHEDSDLVY